MINLEYLRLLRKMINKLITYYGDISILEFEQLYKTDEVFRKNIQLEVKDIVLITQKLYKNLNSTSV